MLRDQGTESIGSVKNDAFRSPFPAHAGAHQRAFRALIRAGRRVGTHEVEAVRCKELLLLGFKDLHEVVTVGLSAKFDARVVVGNAQRPHSGPLTGRDTSLIHHQRQDIIDCTIAGESKAENVGVLHYKKPFALEKFPT